MSSDAGFAQTAERRPSRALAEQKKQKQAKRKPAKPQQDAQAAAPVMNARAQIGGAPVQSLDTITVAASKTEERAIDALAPVSVVTLEQIQGLQPNRLSDIFYNVPGVSFQERGDDPATVINIRGLQDFGRVAVVVDGARQNYQRTGHNANGSFFLDPELVGGVDVVRGPTANIYGSGAIGGVVSFRTKDINDVVRPGERWGVDMTGSDGTNNARGLGSIFGGVRADPNVDVFGGAVYRTQGNYKDGNGTEIGNTGNEIAGRPDEAHRAARRRPRNQVRRRVPGLPIQHRAAQSRADDDAGAARAESRARRSMRPMPRTTRGRSPGSTPSRTTICSTGTPSLYGNRTDNDQTKTYHYSTTGAAYCGAGNVGNNISGCVGDKRGYVLDTARHRRQQHDALQCRRLAKRGHARCRRVSG